jgi:hypothetical protein
VCASRPDATGQHQADGRSRQRLCAARPADGFEALGRRYELVLDRRYLVRSEVHLNGLFERSDAVGPRVESSLVLPASGLPGECAVRRVGVSVDQALAFERGEDPVPRLGWCCRCAPGRRRHTGVSREHEAAAAGPTPSGSSAVPSRCHLALRPVSALPDGPSTCCPRGRDGARVRPGTAGKLRVRIAHHVGRSCTSPYRGLTRRT